MLWSNLAPSRGPALPYTEVEFSSKFQNFTVSESALSDIRVSAGPKSPQFLKYHFSAPYDRSLRHFHSLCTITVQRIEKEVPFIDLSEKYDEASIN